MCFLPTRTFMGQLRSASSAERIANCLSVIGMCYRTLQRHFLRCLLMSQLSLQVQDWSCLRLRHYLRQYFHHHRITPRPCRKGENHRNLHAISLDFSDNIMRHVSRNTIQMETSHPMTWWIHLRIVLQRTQWITIHMRTKPRFC